MYTPAESLWSFAYSIGKSRFSFDIVAPSREIAESAVRSAICEGAIVPSSACGAPRVQQGASKS